MWLKKMLISLITTSYVKSGFSECLSLESILEQLHAVILYIFHILYYIHFILGTLYSLGYLMLMLSCSVMSDSVIPWSVVRQAPLSMGFFSQEYWSGLPFPTPGDLPHPAIGPIFICILHRQADSLPLCHLGIPIICLVMRLPWWLRR